MNMEWILERIKGRLNKENDPTFIAICGWADTGKTTLAQKIADGLLRMNITSDSFSTDSFMLERQERNRLGISGYDPQALCMEKLRHAMETLSAGKAYAYYPYDNRAGKNAATCRWIQPSDVYIIEGIHSFDGGIRKQTSFNIYIHADNDTLQEMRVHANIKKRGFNEADARARVASEMKDFIRYTLPGSKYADLRIQVDVHYNYEIVQES